MIKGTIQQAYTPNIGAPKYVKQSLVDIKGEIDRNTIIIGDFNTTLTSMNRSSRQKSNKETVALNDTLDQMDLIYIFRAFHPIVAEYVFKDRPHVGTQNKSQ